MVGAPERRVAARAEATVGECSIRRDLGKKSTLIRKKSEKISFRAEGSGP